MSKISFNEPAREWEEALPIGNGRMGAMIYGSPECEHLQLNEESIWYGGPVNRINEDTKENLPIIRKLIFAGKISEAEKLMRLSMTGTPNGQHPYQTLGDLHIYFNHSDNITDYYRELNLNDAVALTHYNADGIRFERRYIASHVADMIIMQLSTEKEGALSFELTIDRGRFYDGVKRTSDNELYMYGNLGRGGYEFAVKCNVICCDGKVNTIGERIIVDDATNVTLVIASDCSYHLSKKDKEAAIKKMIEEVDITKTNIPTMDIADKSLYEINELKMQYALQGLLCDKMDSQIRKAGLHNFEWLLNEHIKDYQSLYNRVGLKLSNTEDKSKLYFDFGRYLMISCSRQGGLPATLQGLWNKDMTPPWECKFTININTEMNYWPAEICNLSECHMPLFDLLEKIIPEGRKAALAMYGCRGFVCHHNTDIHGDASPQDEWIPGTYWVMGAAWLCTHIYTHYIYTRDTEFLKKYFPVICESALFFTDFLVEHDGYLVTCPSVSPENTYILPNGESGANGYGVTMDNQILHDLFNQCAALYDEIIKNGLEDDELISKLNDADIHNIGEFINNIKDIDSKVMSTKIGSDGRIMEWPLEYEELEPGHRHISHLYGLYPSNQISVDITPELAKAARKTLENRLSNGGGHTGWSRAWIINHYAKLWDGEEAYHHLMELFDKSTYPNMFDKHPPFQIDGNFGGTAAIANMLLQSNEDRIVLLPALPKAWESGSIKGLKAVNDIEVYISWDNGKLKECILKADKDIEVIVKYGENKKIISLKAKTDNPVIF